MFLTMILGFALNQTSVSDITENIRILNGHISESRANQLAKVISKESKKYDINPNILTAILRQESNFKSEQKVCYIVHRHHACFQTCDLGIGQINRIWVDKWALNEQTMIVDDALNIHIAASVLSIIKRPIRRRITGIRDTIHHWNQRGLFMKHQII